MPAPADYRPPPISEVEPGLFIADELDIRNESILRDNHITAVISLVADSDPLWTRPKFRRYIAFGRNLWVECLDKSTQDLLVHMGRVCDFIDQMLRTPPLPGEMDCSSPLASTEFPLSSPQAEFLQQKRETGSDAVYPIVVHCSRGVSRAPTMVTAYLMRKYRKSRDVALAEVKQRRKVKPNPNFMEQLEIWEQVEYQIWEDEEGTIPKAPYKAFLERRAVLLKEKGLTGNEPSSRPLTLLDGPSLEPSSTL